MPSMDDVVGIHEYALKVRAKRTELIAANIANSDTPNYKARDIDFRAMLADEQRRLDGSKVSAGRLDTRDARHIGVGSTQGSFEDPLYRNPYQDSIDGNSVDTQLEKGKFMENSIQYQATVNFISDRFSGMTKALKGQ
ncbi:MAG: flagellar basal body rod protein FlgB [Gammaproteobacteria bacterium]|nr:flagellar basal body rod protein FlgB [Gammaproteobacteria bacterium]